MKGSKKKYIFALLPVIILFVLLEVGARLVLFLELKSVGFRIGAFDVLFEPYDRTWDDNFVFDYFSGYRARQSVSPESRRPPKIPGPAKKPDEVRILCLGDSVAYGYELLESDAWPARLQVYLNQRTTSNKTYEVYNGGVIGYSPQQCKRLLQSRLIQLEPDIILWAENPFFADSLPLPDEHLSERGARTMRKLAHSRFFYLLLNLRRLHVDEQFRFLSPNRYLFDAKPSRNGEHYVLPILPQFIQWCKERGVRLFLGIENVSYTNGEITKTERYTGDSHMWENMKLGYLPTLDFFNTYSRDGTALLMDVDHFTKKGSDAFASHLCNTLLKRLQTEDF